MYVHIPRVNSAVNEMRKISTANEHVAGLCTEINGRLHFSIGQQR